MDQSEVHFRKQRSVNTTTRSSCFSKLCCCCCIKENGGVHDIHDDSMDDLREQGSKKHGDMRCNEIQANKEMVMEDHASGERLPMDKASVEKKTGPKETLPEEGRRPSEGKGHGEERRHEEKFDAEGEGQFEQEKKPKEVKSHVLEGKQHDEIMRLRTQVQIMESETSRRNMEQAQKMQESEDKIRSLERKLRNQEADHAVEIKRLQKKLVESELMRDINEKFNKSEMSGNIQNTLERDKLIFQVQTFFKDTLCDLTEKDDSVEQESLVKAFVVMYRRAVKKVSDLVSHFAAAHNVGAVAEAIDNIVTQMGAASPIKEAVTKELKRVHRPPFYTDREGSRLSDEEWQLFQNVMFLKSVTVKMIQPQETIRSCLIEVAHETMGKLAEITRSAPSADVQEGFIAASVPVIVNMILSPNPIIPWISLETFEAKYVTMDLWEYEDFKEAMKVSKADGYPIAAFKRPILLTCTYQSIVVEPGFVRMKLTTTS